MRKPLLFNSLSLADSLTNPQARANPTQSSSEEPASSRSSRIPRTRAYARVSASTRMRRFAYSRLCVCVCVFVYMLCASARASMCVHAWVHVCVCACVRWLGACVWVELDRGRHPSDRGGPTNRGVGYFLPLCLSAPTSPHPLSPSFSLLLSLYLHLYLSIYLSLSLYFSWFLSLVYSSQQCAVTEMFHGDDGGQLASAGSFVRFVVVHEIFLDFHLT